MTQIPTIAVPSAQLAAPQISPGPDIFGPIERLARGVLEVGRARKIAEGGTQRIKAIGESVLQADQQPTVDGALTTFSQGLEPLAQSIEQEQDPVVREALAERLAFDRERFVIQVRQAAVRREGQSALAAEDARFDADILSGRPPEEIAQGRRLGVDALVPMVLTPQQADERARSGALRAAREHYNRLLRDDPAAAGEFIMDDFAASAMPADERDDKRREAGRDLLEHQGRVFEALLDQEREDLFSMSREAGPQAFGVSVNEAVAELFKLPGNQASPDEIRVGLLSRMLTTYALEGEEDRFALIESVMGDSLDAANAIARQRRTLESRRRNNDALAKAILDIRMSAVAGFSLRGTPIQQEAVDLMFAGMDLDMTTEEGQEQMLKEFGHSSVLPTAVTRWIEATMLPDPQKTNAEMIQQVTTLLNAIRVRHDRAYDRLGNDIKGLLGTYNRVRSIGDDPKAAYQLAWDSIMKPDPLRAAEVSRREPELRRFFGAELIKLIDENFNIQLPTTEIQQVFAGIEEGAVQVDPRSLGLDLPFGLIEQYAAIGVAHVAAGRSLPAAAVLAFDAVDDELGATKVFRDRAVITRLAPERVSGGLSTEQIEQDIMFILSRDMALGLVQLPAVRGRVAPPRMKLTNIVGGTIIAKDSGSMKFALEQGVPEQFRISNLNELNDWGRQFLRIEPTRSEDFETEVGGQVLYRLLLIDQNNVTHQILRRNQQGELTPFLVGLFGGYSRADMRRLNNRFIFEATERAEKEVMGALQFLRLLPKILTGPVARGPRP